MSVEIDDSDNVKGVVEEELSRFRNHALANEVRAFLVTPVLQNRYWGNREPFTQIPCWLVADLKARNVGIVYSQQGHGENGYYWNLVFLDEEYLDTGNSGCYKTLEELIRDSGYFSN